MILAPSSIIKLGVAGVRTYGSLKEAFTTAFAPADGFGDHTHCGYRKFIPDPPLAFLFSMGKWLERWDLPGMLISFLKPEKDDPSNEPMSAKTT